MSKPKIKPSADTEVSMWNSGYKVGVEKTLAQVLVILDKFQNKIKKFNSPSGLLQYYKVYYDDMKHLREELKQNLAKLKEGKE